jgi:3',5'-cyclic AMP phosphodiesterase CpdA
MTRAQKPCSGCALRFVVYGDTRNDIGGSDGDKIHAGIVAEVIKYKPGLVLQTGDLVLNAGKLNEWARFDQIIAPLKANGIAYFPTRGNHDNNSNGEYQKRVTEAFRAGGNPLYYAFDRGNVRFIAIDTETKLVPGRAGKPGSVQYEWLRNELANAKDEHRLIIPFFHKSIYSIGAKHGSDVNLRAVIEPLFKDAGVKLVFQGHDHIYYHTKRGDIVYIVAGGGGAPLYDLRTNQEITGDQAQKANNFLVCDVFKDRIEVTTYISRKPLQGGVYVQFEQFIVPLTP